MKLRHHLVAILFGFVGFPLTEASAEPAHSSAQRIVVDAHNDSVQRILLEHLDLGVRQPDGGIDLPRLHDGGVNVSFFALYVPDFYKGAEAVRRTLDFRDAMSSLFQKYSDRVEIATSAADIAGIVGRGKVAIVLTIEGGHQIDNDLAVLRMYRQLGIVSMTLTHFRSNDWADSSTSPPEHNGLTEFGKRVVREMNTIGMLVDVSHVSDKTFYDVLSVSTRPVIASHSSCRSRVDHPRNMSDDMLVALGKNGGVVGVNFYSGFLSQEDATEATQHIAQSNSLAPPDTGNALDQFAEHYYAESGWAHPKIGHATVEDAVDCIDHIAKLIGTDHVGIGSDFDGVPSVPRGLEDATRMPAVAEALRRRGYSDQDVRKIMGDNFVRVLRQAVDPGRRAAVR